MGVRILADDEDRQAVMYCSTTDWAFGPVFSSDEHHTATEWAQAFLRWLDTTETWRLYQKHPRVTSRRDPRELTDAGMEAAYTDWLAQEAEQSRREACEAVEEGRG